MLRGAKQAGRCFLGHSFYQKSDKSRPHMQSVLSKRDTTNILLSPSHLTSHNDILQRMAFGAILLTVYPRSGRLHVWLLGSGRSAAPADPVIPRLCVCRHVSGGHSALSDLTVLWKVITRRPAWRPYQRPRRRSAHKFLPCLSCFSAGNRLDGETARQQRPEKRQPGVLPALKWLRSHPIPAF